MGNHFKTAVQFCADALLFAILVLGLFGVVYKLVGPNGLVASAGGKLWRDSPGLAALVTLGAAVALFWFKRHMDASPGRGGIWDKLVYAWIAVGAYFAVRLAVTGHL